MEKQEGKLDQVYDKYKEQNESRQKYIFGGLMFIVGFVLGYFVGLF